MTITLLPFALAAVKGQARWRGSPRKRVALDRAFAAGFLQVSEAGASLPARILATTALVLGNAG